MSSTNLHIDDRASEYRSMAVLKAELAFWQDHATNLQLKLDNIPRAIAEYGYIDIIDRRETIRLVADPQSPSTKEESR